MNFLASSHVLSIISSSASSEAFVCFELEGHFIDKNLYRKLSTFSVSIFWAQIWLRPLFKSRSSDLSNGPKDQRPSFSGHLAPEVGASSLYRTCKCCECLLGGSVSPILNEAS